MAGGGGVGQVEGLDLVLEGLFELLAAGDGSVAWGSGWIRTLGKVMMRSSWMGC